MKKITFKFYGALRKYCGKEIEIYGRTVNETMRSLCIQIPNLKRHMKYKKYNLKVGHRDVGQDEYIDGVDVEKDIVVRVIPVIHGAGPFAFVAGAALAALSYVEAFAAVATVLLQLGVGLMLSGAAALLTKQPKFNQDHQGVEDSKSSSFSNLSNMVGQGKQILRVYGEMLVAGYVISQGLSSRRIDAWGTDIKDVQSANYVRQNVDLIASTDPNGKTYNIDRNCDSVRNAAVNIQANWS